MVVQSLLYSETYESMYGKKRQEGQALLADYCHKKVHLQLPKPESLLKGHLPKPVEDKPKVLSSYKHCSPEAEGWDVEALIVAEALRGGKLKSAHTKCLPPPMVNLNQASCLTDGK